MKTKISAGLLLTSLALFGCNPQASQSANADNNVGKVLQEAKTQQEKQHAEDVNSYFLGLDEWSKLAPARNDENKLKSKKTSTVPSSQGQAPQTCTVEEYDLIKTPEKIVMQNPAVEILYPGALIQGVGYLQGPGGVRELPIRQRAAMTIVSDLTSDKNAITIDNINYASYQQAYSQLIQDSMARGAKVRGNIIFNQVEVQKSEQAALDLGFSVKYLGNSLNGELHTKSNDKENTFMVVFEHRAFTISAVAPSTPAGFFSTDLSVEDLKVQESFGNLGPQNPPLYVSNVSYGRILMFTVTSKASKSEIQGALNAVAKKVGNGATVDIKAEQQKILNEATIRVLSIGGEPSQAIELIKSGNIKDYFTTTPHLDAYVPLSYTFRNIRDNSIAKVAEATSYSKVECTPRPAKAYKVRIALESLKVKRGWSPYYAYVYGTISLNNKTIWNHTRSQYVTIGKSSKTTAAEKPSDTSEENIFDSNKHMVEIILPVKAGAHKGIPLVATLYDNGSPAFNIPTHWVVSEKFAEISENIGVTTGGGVLADGIYSIKNNNVDIYYSVKKLEPIYEDEFGGAGGDW